MYRIAIVLSIIFVYDMVFMTWAWIYGGYAGIGYGLWSFFPAFVPATLVSLAVIGMYVRGFRRLSWKPRRLERVYFIVFAAAMAAKVVWWILGDPR